MGIVDCFSDLMAGVGFQEAHAEAPAEEEDKKDEGGDEDGEEKSEEGGEDAEGEAAEGEEEAGEAEEEEEDDEPVDPKPKFEAGSVPPIRSATTGTDDPVEVVVLHSAISRLTARVFGRMCQIRPMRALQAPLRRMCGESHGHARGSQIQGPERRLRGRVYDGPHLLPFHAGLEINY